MNCFVCRKEIPGRSRRQMVVQDLGGRGEARLYVHEGCWRLPTPPQFTSVEEADNWLYEHRPAPF